MLRLRYAHGAGGRRRCAASRWAAAANSRCMRAPRRGDGDLRRPGRGRRRPDSGRRRPGGIARRAAEMALGRQRQAPTSCSSSRTASPAPRWPRSATSAIESRKLGYLLRSDVIVPHKDELLHVATAQARAMSESGYRPPRARRRSRSPAATASRRSRRSWSTCATAASSARTTSTSRADRRGGLRRRRRRRLAGERGVPDDLERKALLRAARPPQDPGTDHGHAADRQAGAQLKDHANMSKQVQDAYIVAATRTPIGKAGARHVPQHAPRRSAGRRDPAAR